MKICPLATYTRPSGPTAALSPLLNKQIGFDPGIAEAIVKAHRTALMRKRNVRNRMQVAIAAQSMGWRDAKLPH